MPAALATKLPEHACPAMHALNRRYGIFQWSGIFSEVLTMPGSSSLHRRAGLLALANRRGLSLTLVRSPQIEEPILLHFLRAWFTRC
jgi:hypothetical protein